MDQESFETLTLPAAMVGDGRDLLADNVLIEIQKYNGNPIGIEFPPHVELTVTATEPGVRGDTASGGVTKAATLETGLEIRVPLFIKEGEKVKVHTETREFAGEPSHAWATFGGRMSQRPHVCITLLRFAEPPQARDRPPAGCHV